jgi:hypothetical protein
VKLPPKRKLSGEYRGNYLFPETESALSKIIGAKGCPDKFYDPGTIGALGQTLRAGQTAFRMARYSPIIEATAEAE